MYRSLGLTRRAMTALTAAAADFGASFSAVVVVSGCPGRRSAVPAKPIVVAPLIDQDERHCNISREDGLVNRSAVDEIVLMVSVVLG